MSMLSEKIADSLARGSAIRKMFELGAELKKIHGADKVYDFSLGNPDLPPPPAVGQALAEIAKEADKPFSVGYMPNAGYPDVRESLAVHAGKEQSVPYSWQDIVITCGAAGGLNCFFRAVLDPGEEVICPSPFFVEYGFYVGNHGGKLVTVPSKLPSFDLDVDALLGAINDKTRVVMINSPNNPTGVIYPEATLKALADGLMAENAKRKRPIYLLSDEPYRFLAYDGAVVPSLPKLYPFTVVGTSFSKNLSLPGERVGYLAVAPNMPDKAQLVDGLVFANRTLGFVNAPCIGQRLIQKVLGSQVDAAVYADRRAAMAKVLTDAGYEFTMPQGAFYFFPKAPIADETAFVDKLTAERVLAAPGRGFGLPGYFRLAFCVDRKVIENSAEGFKKAKANC